MRVLFCVSEAVPFAKTGGLADVGGALPPTLAGSGCDVRMILPRYRSIPKDGLRELGTVTVPVGPAPAVGSVYETTLPGTDVEVWLIDQPQWFDRPGLYGEEGRDYADNLARFTFFCRAALAWTGQQSWRPDILHCHDWQTALIPVIARTEGPSVPTVLTIHNLGYQGLFPADQFGVTRLPDGLFTMQGLEFWGQLNVLKGGLVFADGLSTVSERYAEEIQTPEMGAGLDGVLRERRAVLVGILNGVDYRVWDPAIDALIPAHYSADDLAGKALCKAHLQRELGLAAAPATPLIGMVTRLADQKGIDLVAKVIEDALRAGAQLALLGTGDPRYETLFTALGRRYPAQAGVRIGFDNALAHRIEAGADCFLMPSRYEPSGLNQLYSLRYGTVPIVRRTGGLADSVVDATPPTLADGTANGFVFEDYRVEALRAAILRALQMYRRDPSSWKALQYTGMRADFSWTRSAARYVDLYRRTANRSAAPGSPARR